MDLNEAITKLRSLNQPVPMPLALPSDADVIDAEVRLNIKLHDDFRRLLLEAGDVTYGTIEPCTISDPSSHVYLDTVLDEAREAGVSKDVIPICQDNGDLYLQNSVGEISYWSHNGVARERWSDLATWIEDVWLDG